MNIADVLNSNWRVAWPGSQERIAQAVFHGVLSLLYLLHASLKNRSQLPYMIPLNGRRVVTALSQQVRQALQIHNRVQVCRRLLSTEASGPDLGG